MGALTIINLLPPLRRDEVAIAWTICLFRYCNKEQDRNSKKRGGKELK
jgi:hypothetical protein